MTSATTPQWLPAVYAQAWDRASPRERRIVIFGVAIVVLALAWALIWQPLARDIGETQVQLGRDARALAAARAMTDEGAGLARDAKPVAGGEPRAAVERVLTERALRTGASIDMQDGRVKVVLPAVRFAALVAALESLRKDAGLRVVEATLTARVEPGTVRADLVLAR